MKHHWYVTYTYRGFHGGGDGSLAMFTSENWFPIRMARDWIKSETKSNTVIITSWRHISEKQHAEFTESERYVNQGELK